MSLSKQLLLLISLLFFAVFSVNFYISVNNIRGYLEVEAEVHAQDTATSLGLSLSPYMVDEKDPVIETMMNAIFDMGYYQEIKLVNAENQPLVTLTNKKKVDGVPDAFIKLFPMQTASAKSEISSGWNIAGEVHVTINPGYAYFKLYEQVKRSFFSSVIAFVFSVLLLFFVLRATLMGLKRIELLALDIAEGHYEEKIEPLPWTIEIKNVALAMNLMTKKIANAIKNLNNRLDIQGKKLQQDDLTGLYKKSVFETDMKALFASDIDAFIYMIKVDSVKTLAKEMGEAAIDEFLIEFAESLLYVSSQNESLKISAYRFYGSEFVLLAKNTNKEAAEKLAGQLSIAFSELGEKYQRVDIAHIGVTEFNPVMTTKNMLLAANEAYEQALLIGANSYYVRKSGNRAKDIAEWKSLVFNIIDNRSYKVSLVGNIEEFKSGNLFMQEAFTEAFDDKVTQLSIGTFVSIAEKFAKIVDLDIGVTQKIIEYLENEQVSNFIAVNLSSRTIKNIRFRAWLVDSVNKNPDVTEKLVFSLSAYAVAKEAEIYKEFIEFAHKLKIKVVIKRFETQSISPELVKELRPDFIRLARDLGNGISLDKEKKSFVETLMDIGDLLDIGVLAENVQSEEDFACIKSIGITGASR